MNWYAAHIVMKVVFKSGLQKKFPVWENIYLVSASDEEHAFEKAGLIGLENEGDCLGSFQWGGEPSKWVFLGVRKLLTLSNSHQIDVSPADGTEVTYSTIEFKNEDDLNNFINCKNVLAKIRG